MAVSGVDHSIKLIRPTPLPMDETEEEHDARIEKRKSDASQVMGGFSSLPLIFLFRPIAWLCT